MKKATGAYEGGPVGRRCGTLQRSILRHHFCSWYARTIPAMRRLIAVVGGLCTESKSRNMIHHGGSKRQV